MKNFFSKSCKAPHSPFALLFVGNYLSDLVWSETTREFGSHLLHSASLQAETFVIPLGQDTLNGENRHLVYAPLRKTAFVCDEQGVLALQQLQQPCGNSQDAELFKFLDQLGLLDSQPDLPPDGRFSGSPNPISVTLFMTTSCNLRCHYCWAAAGDTPRHRMPLNVAKAGIDFVIGNALKAEGESFEVVFHGGGEPTVNWRTLTDAWEHAREQADAKGLIFRSSLTTNGVLTEAQAEWIANHIDTVTVSYDGSPQSHDAHRVTVTGGPSSAKVEATLRLFDQLQVRYGVRVTVTADRIESLPQSIRYLCENFEPARIHIEPAFPLGRWRDAPSAEISGFIDAYREAKAIARRLGKDVYFSGANIEKTSSHFCGVTRDGFSLTHNGKVSACYEVFLDSLPQAEQFLYGEYRDEDFRFQTETLDALRNQTVDNREFCRGCFAKWNCSGDCLHRAVADGGEFSGSERCHIIRELTKDLILEKIADSGGVVWNEPQDRPMQTEAQR